MMTRVSVSERFSAATRHEGAAASSHSSLNAVSVIPPAVSA